MFYVVDSAGRVICRSASYDVVHALAYKIARAGAWVAVATDDPEEARRCPVRLVVARDAERAPRLGPTGAFEAEYPDDGRTTDPDDVRRAVWGA